MNYLKAKTQKEIMDDFRKKYDIHNNHEWNQMVKYIRRPKFGKHIVLVWGLSLVILGLCFVIVILTSLDPESIAKLPLIFPEINGFLERFINIIQVTVMMIVGFLLIILPWFRIAEVYDWGD